jgi:hypothetical protein
VTILPKVSAGQMRRITELYRVWLVSECVG